MPVIKRSTTIPQDKRKIFSILKNMEYFPRFISGVESINVKRLSEDLVISNWRINVDGTVITWEEEDLFNDKTCAIDFKMREGDYGSYEGGWRLIENSHGTEIQVTARIDWNLAGITREINKALDKKAELALRWMLWEIRKSALYPQDGLDSFWESRAKIVSELITFQNREGKKIVGFYDHLDNATIRDNFIISPPGYGETKRDALTTAYHLVRNGFNIIRYDATDHIGESDGEILNTTMTKLKRDLLSAIDFVEKTYGVSRIGVVASSLAKRMAIKAASEDKRIVFLLGVVGVVDLQRTLKTVYSYDIIQKTIDGTIDDVCNVLGFDVSKEYSASAVRDNYHDLYSTQKDLKKINIPVVFLVAEKDAWVRLEDVKFVMESSKQRPRELHVIPEAMHQLFENPKAAHVAMKQIVVSCFRHIKHREINLDRVLAPTMREMAAQNKIEKERLRKLTKRTVQEEKDFWGKYITDFTIIKKSPDYKELLDSILDYLMPFKDEQVFLDAGCGVGYMGIWLLLRFIENYHKGKGLLSQKCQTYKYVGLDFVETTLMEAQKNHINVLSQFCLDENIGDFPIKFAYDLVDLNHPLPYASNSIDKVCSSLVVSYVRNPSLTVMELFRVLKPGGAIVLSTLKPYADLSQIYKNFVDQATSEQEIVEARKLLSSAGQIKRREGDGHYYFFSEKELKTLMVAAGANNVRTFRSFGNQANVVVAVKE
ncbi:MAG: hypothetical protein AUJ71_03730 [Candidatus Omnitrophica bacterium CG1_02_49_16]|nr:MAG: hypothetical protein AUJ71_03730 [Candidatus Omnitrophica bacterium CG1_02_49_16]